MDINLADGVDIAAQTIITGRGCAIGQSGSGKSFLAGVIAEELCRSGMPFCVLDIEGEYSSLRSVSKKVIVVGGESGDLGLDVDFERLFEASISNDMPVVMDLSDAMDKNEVAQKALGALYSVESKMRRPYLVMVEEADKFAPQVVGVRDNMVEEISVRGRKRGIGLFITTQRPANISKNVLAQCSYGFVGKLTIENDLNALRILIGSSDRLASLTRLGTGEFMMFGLKEAGPFKVKSRSAPHIGMTPSISTYRPENSKVASIIRELKLESATERRTMKPRQKAAETMIKSLHANITRADAEAYAGKVSRRMFIFFGKTRENVDSIYHVYVPVWLCVIRMPTLWKNEYREYRCIVGGKRSLLRLKGRIRELVVSNEKKGSASAYMRYLSKSDVLVEDADASDAEVLHGMDSKKARSVIRRLFPDASIASMKEVHIPSYRITLRQGNRVRVFGIDGVYGKKLAV